MNGPPVDADDAARLDSLASFSEFGRSPARGRPGGAPPIQFVFDGQVSAEPPKMLVKGLVPADGICFVAGQSGAGKTFVEIHMAICLASGADFFGHKIKDRAGCAILAAEGAGGLQRRIDAAKRGLDIADALPIAWTPVAENLLEPASLRRIIEALKVLCQQFVDEHGVRLGAVFVDTIGAAFGLEDENDAAKVNAAMRTLRQIGDAIGAVVIPIHHYGKAAATGLRGSSAFRGAADAVLSVLAERDEITGESENRSLCLAKAREGEEGPIGAFRLQFIQLGFDEDGEEFGSCVVDAAQGLVQSRKEKQPKLTKGAKIALAALREAIDDCGELPPASSHIPPNVKAVNIETWRAYAAKAGITGSDEPDALRKAFGRAHETLVSDRHIGVWTPWAWPA